MPRFCSPESKCKGFFHLDWNDAHDQWDGPVLTFLRDPVERGLSEFYFLRTKDGKGLANAAQWNFKNKEWLQKVQNAAIDDAMDAYFHGDPKNPGLNRQALYLLGFNDPSKPIDKMRPLPQGVPAPGEKYSWDRDHDSLLAQAKEKLDKLPMFGITDCYLTSVKVIARKSGWNESAVVDFAKTHHNRQQNKVAAFSWSSNVKSRGRFVKIPIRNSAELSSTSTSCGSGRWRDYVTPDLIDMIEKTNAVDMELFRYAKQRFQERFGETCST